MIFLKYVLFLFLFSLSSYLFAKECTHQSMNIFNCEGREILLQEETLIEVFEVKNKIKLEDYLSNKNKYGEKIQISDFTPQYSKNGEQVDGCAYLLPPKIIQVKNNDCSVRVCYSMMKCGQEKDVLYKNVFCKARTAEDVCPDVLECIEDNSISNFKKSEFESLQRKSNSSGIQK